MLWSPLRHVLDRRASDEPVLSRPPLASRRASSCGPPRQPPRSRRAAAAAARSEVVDQTGLPLPGVRIDVYRGQAIIETVTTAGDGTFQLTPGAPSDMVDAALEGFEAVRVPRAQATHIVLLLGRTTEVTEVVASALTSSGTSMERLGSTMSAPMAQKLPTAAPAYSAVAAAAARRRARPRRAAAHRRHAPARVEPLDRRLQRHRSGHGHVGDRSAGREREGHGRRARSDFRHVRRRARIDGVDRDDDRRRSVQGGRSGIHSAAAAESPVRARPHRSVLPARLRQRPGRVRALFRLDRIQLRARAGARRDLPERHVRRPGRPASSRSRASISTCRRARR